ncbi:transglycosylase SLT domain-containing protein [Xanthomonas citri]|uniref:transglycosylase SLT domain-containing protein n=1 Tax=Xanthomonas citri TaxID=346 RepID=UPI0015E17E6B|nr:transglycosylase SLT domain-containing protein [Xanthomonas citri]
MIDVAAYVIESQKACIAQAAQAYGVDRSDIIVEIRLRAGGRGRIVQLANGQYEVGVMRIPSAALPSLASYGVDLGRLMSDDCLGIQVGSYMLRLRQIEVARASVGNNVAELGSRAACVRAAAARYRVPEQIVWTILRTEGGTTGKVSRNSNGTYDMGQMQINSVHLKSAPYQFEKYGITRDALVNNQCLNINVGTYMLASEISRAPSFWKGVTNYHSRTPQKAAVYLSKVLKNLVAVQSEVQR